MTKGLRCPNCDTTINRRAVNDWLVNKKTKTLNCTNAFCNTSWRRSVLEKHAAQFIGEVKPTVAKPAPRPKPVEARVRRPVRRAVAKVAPASKPGSWLDRIRTVAQHHANIHGVVSIDDLRLWADIHKDLPTSSSAWGSVFHGAQWRKVSQKNSTYAKSRSRKISVWSLKAVAVAVGA